ncbi:MAG: hypothetical protein WDW36_004899 [Sanguina aurantia]
MFWQLGVMKGLGEHYDLTKTPMIASSSGAVAVAFAACGVDMAKAVERGVALSHEFGVEQRRFGLVGIWGQLVRRWLEDLLPEDAHVRAQHTTLLVTTLPRLRTRRYSKFHSKDDLIQVIMASAHIPLILDWQWYVQCREHAACIDGGFWWWFCRSEREYLYSCDTTHGDIDPCLGPVPECTAADLAAARSSVISPDLPPSGCSTSSSASGNSRCSGAGIRVAGVSGGSGTGTGMGGGGSVGGGGGTHCNSRGEAIMLIRPYDDESFMANIAEYDRIKPRNSAVALEMMVYGEAFAKQMMQRWALAGITDVGPGTGNGS